jgi:hypothetical protein
MSHTTHQRGRERISVRITVVREDARGCHVQRDTRHRGVGIRK